MPIIVFERIMAGGPLFIEEIRWVYVQARTKKNKANTQSFIEGRRCGAPYLGSGSISIHLQAIFQ
jgi:hypothetical protein